MSGNQQDKCGLARDGIAAQFRTRADADVAIEHLIQEYGIEASFIYAEPLGEENSNGTRVSGGDHSSGLPSHLDRGDAPLHGRIQVTVLMRHEDLTDIAHSVRAHVLRDLKSCGAIIVEEF